MNSCIAFLRTCAILAFLIVLQGAAKAQETRTIGGKRYIVHRVEAGQTLYAISRSHAVPVEALLSANPEVGSSLSIGQELLVPQEAVVKKDVRSAPVLLRDGELQHTAARKETLFGIARQYGVEVNDLLERNPGLDTGLREGMTVVIPAGKVRGQDEWATRPATVGSGSQHTVVAGETLFALGQRYGMDPEAIRTANGGLPEGLKAGQVIVIPGLSEISAPAPPAPEAAFLRERYKVAFALPFALTRNDSALAATANDPRFYEPSRIAAQFYAGALLAMDSLERIGLRADVSVLDVGDDPATWNSTLKRHEMKEIDLVIGPFHRSAIEQVVRVAPKAHVVCPVQQSNKVILGNPTVSKVVPTRTDLIAHTARFVTQRHARENIILLRPEIASDKDIQEQMAKGLQAGLSGQQARMRDSVLVARPGKRDLGDLPGKLSAERTNVLVAPSEDVEYVTTLVNKLKPLSGKYRILLIGLEGWSSMGSVSAADLDGLGFHFASSSFIDRTEAHTRAFTRQFRERFDQDADEFAFIGFDVTLYYMRALMEHGTNFPEHFAEIRTTPMHMGFRMVRAGPENGYRNEYAIMLQQKDLLLHKAP